MKKMLISGNYCGSMGFIYDVFICFLQSYKMVWLFFEFVNVDEVFEYYDVIIDFIGELFK